MKEKQPLIITRIIGLILLIIGLATSFDYYSTMLFAMGCGLVSAATVHLLYIAYWQNPKRQEACRERQREAHINSIDERKQFLRMKAGHISYEIMTFATLILSVLLALFRVEAWVIAMVFVLFLIQWTVGVIAYRVLQKRM